MKKKPEPVQVVKQRRDAVLRTLVEGVPYIQFMGIVFERRGDELTGIMPFKEELIGNPMLPALHGGATSAFLEVCAIISLSWGMIWEDMESGALEVEGLDREHLPRLPKTIDFTVDYLR